MGITNALGSLYGAFLAVIFFANSREARQRWKLFCGNRNTHFVVRCDDLHINTDDPSNFYLPDLSEGEAGEFNGDDPYTGLLESISQQSSPAVSFDSDGRKFARI